MLKLQSMMNCARSGVLLAAITYVQIVRVSVISIYWKLELILPKSNSNQSIF